MHMRPRRQPTRVGTSNPHRETSLNDDYTQAALDEVGYSRGFARGEMEAFNAPDPVDKNPTLVRNPNHRFASRTVVTNSLPSPVIGASMARRYLLIQNVGAVTVYLGFGVTPSLTGKDSIELPAGVGIAFENGIVPSGEVEAISATESKLAFIDGTEL